VAGATLYAIAVFEVGGSTSAVVYEAYTSSICDTSGTCSVTPAISLVEGKMYGWYTISYDVAWGEWSAGLTFIVSLLPPAPVAISPVGSSAPYTWTPSYSWHKVPFALLYAISVYDYQSGHLVFTKAYVGSTICSETQCSAQPRPTDTTNAVLTAGKYYQWYVIAYTHAGWGQWSTGTLFRVHPWSCVTGITVDFPCAWLTSTPATFTPSPTLAPTFVPTIVPGICRIKVNVGTGNGINAYNTPEDAAVADPVNRAGVFGDQILLEVYSRSNLYSNLVKVGVAAFPTQRYWIDSGDGVVQLVSGDCSVLPTQTMTITNPQSKPTFTKYPLHSLSVPTPASAELYQFAMSNSIYTSTVSRHPGMDFFRGPAASSPSLGDKVASVANGTIVGYFDPARSPNLGGGQPDWIQNASPTDKANGRAYAVIRHGNTLVLYTHLNPGLRIGGLTDPVVAGQWIGSIAQSEEGPHLHLEVRTYGQQTFDIAQNPLVFVNAWQYFDSPLRSAIDQNTVNRHADDGNTAAGWNGVNPPSLGDQKTQCFTPAAAPSGAPTTSGGIIVYGYDSAGNPNYSAFEWNGMPGPYVVTLSGTWQTRCIP
jgi:hypothetical protein